MILAEANTVAISIRAVLPFPAGVAVMFLAIRVFRRMYTPLVAPIAVVTKGRGGRERPGPWNLFCLFGCYYLCGTILALTGATIGMLPEIWASEQAQPSLIWGFTAGMMVAALARISAVYLTTSLANYLQLLTVTTLGVLTFKFVQDYLQDYRSFTDFIDSLNPLFRESSGRLLIPFSLITTGVTAGTVEVCICLCSFVPRGNPVSYALARDRIEQYELVRQVFWPRNIVRFTNKILKKEIAKDGLDELYWLTNTASGKPMEMAFKALQSRYPGLGPERLMNTFKAVGRVLVSGDLTEEEKDDLAKYMKDTNIRYLSEPVRTRLLIINAKHAIIHLPIPFRGGKAERSNCAFFITSEERVQKLRDVFNLLWEKGLHLHVLERTVKNMVLDNQSELFRVARVVYEYHRPVMPVEIVTALKRRGDEKATAANVSPLLEELEACEVIRRVGGKNLWCPKSFARTCRIADILFDLD